MPEYTCAGCGAEFDRKARNQSQSSQQTYCSKRCYGRSRSKALADVFFDNTHVNTVTGCLEWRGTLGTGGYGVLSIGNRAVRAHRHAWTLEKGAIPKGMAVCHRCDNRRCVNPEHLFLGTNKDNNDDKVQKGRHARGDGHGNVKLTQADVESIRSRYARGMGKALAAEYGVHLNTIVKVAHEQRR